MANRYWVGGTASWDATAGTKWATTSGGAGGAAVPTSADDVFFDANSGVNTVTVAAQVFCNNIDFTGFTGTFAGSSALDVYGSWTFGSGMTRTYTGAIDFLGTGLHTITSNGISFDSPIDFNGTGGKWTLQDNFDNNETSTAIDHNEGEIDLNGFNMALTGTFSTSGSLTRVLTFGDGADLSCFTFSASTSTNLTINDTAGVDGGAIFCFGTGNGLFAGGGLTYNYVDLQWNKSNASGSLANTPRLTGANTFGTLVLRPTTNYGAVRLYANQTVTTSASFLGQDGDNRRYLIRSDTPGTQRTITVNGTFSFLQDVDFVDIVGAGTASWSGTRLGDIGNNSGITFGAGVNRYWVNGSGDFYGSTNHWAATSGGAATASRPLPQDTCIFDANSFTAASQIVDTDAASGSYFRLPNMNWTGVTNSPTLNINDETVFTGDITFVSGMSITGSNTVIFMNRGLKNINMGTQKFLGRVEMECPGGGITLTGNFETDGLFAHQYGEVDMNNFDLTCSSMSSNYTTARTLRMGSGDLIFSGTGQVVTFGNATGLTLIPETSTIRFTDTSTAQKSLVILSGTVTLYDILFAGSNSDSYVFDGNFTFNEMRSTKTAAFTISAGNSGDTITVASWDISGTAGNLVTLNSDVAAAWNLVKTGGGTVSADYLSISRSAATPADTWYAGNNSTDGGNNSGWIFSAPVAVVVTNAPTAIDTDSADFNGDITDLRGGGNATVRGFKYRTVSSGGTPTAEGFESNSLGVFTNDPASHLGWQANSGATGSSSTGPDTQGAQEGTYYVYVETSSAGGGSFNNGDTDIMEADCGAGNLTFQYHQYGTDQGTLYVDYWNGTSWINIWSSTGNQGNQWNASGNVNIPMGASKVRFRNVAAGGFTGDIAVDNVSIPQYSYGTESDTSESGSFGIGTYTLNQASLTSAQFYEVRAYVTSPLGDGFGEYELFETLGLGVQEGEMFLAMG